VDARTGEEHWQERVGGNYSASPILADNKLYLQSESGPAVVLKPGKTFEKLSDTGFAEQTLASYAVGDNALFIRTEKPLSRRAEVASRHSPLTSHPHSSTWTTVFSAAPAFAFRRFVWAQ
jgi:outer membrane protein assembly factor BamB